jgi:1,4-dihydroxy-6-naphthoate synthase
MFMRTLSLGYSPCPNDTFIFYALVHGKIDTGDLGFKEVLLDVETLNKMALLSELDITKISYHAFGYFREDYCLLRSGSAMGRSCGPLLVSKEDYALKDLKGKSIAIPGRLTTANLLFQLFAFESGIQFSSPVEMPFHTIMDSVAKGNVDAGLIIHEGRFTYPLYGLKKIVDLGEWWESMTGLPLPLGGILAKRNLGKDLIKRVDSFIRKSIEYSLHHKEDPKAYIKQHSQELEEKVIEQHINLYVNDFSLDIGEEGLSAVRELFKRAEMKGIIKESRNDILCVT